MTKTMMLVFIATVVIMLTVIALSLILLLAAKGHKYFYVKLRNKQPPDIDFYIRKHAIFRLFMHMCSIGHYMLHTVSVTSTISSIYCN